MRLDKRWYWCTDCGVWHDRTAESDGFHYSMDWDWSEPNERNFEGTGEELLLFRIALQMSADDDKAFNERVKASLERGGGL